MVTLANIINTPIGGNAYVDQGLMDNIHYFASDSNNSWQERSDALDFMQTKIMGCELTKHQAAITPQQNVEEYLDVTG